MWPFASGSREERFWRWFEANSDRLLHFEVDQAAVFRDLTRALKRVDKGLTFEFGPVRDGKREFVVSADGIREHFPAVRQLVAAAPPLEHWIVTPFRPPANIELGIDYGGVRVGPDDVWFLAEPDQGRVGLKLFVRGLTEENTRTLGGAGFILLDNALGEFAVETQVGFIDWNPLPPDPVAVGLKPFRTIREHFDKVAH